MDYWGGGGGGGGGAKGMLPPPPLSNYWAGGTVLVHSVSDAGKFGQFNVFKIIQLFNQQNCSCLSRL